MLVYVTTNGTYVLWCGKTLSSFRISSSSSTINTDLTACWDLSPRQSAGWSGLCGDILRTQKSSGSFSGRLWIIRLIILPFPFHFLKVRVNLGDVVHIFSVECQPSPHSEDFSRLYSNFLGLAIYARREFWSSCSRLMIGSPCPSWNAMIAYEKCH